MNTNNMPPTITSLNNNNMPPTIASLNINSNNIPPTITSSNINNNTNELPPDLENGNDLILTRQYVRSVHQLMGKDIVIPAPAIPNCAKNIILETPDFPNCNNSHNMDDSNSKQKRICFQGNVIDNLQTVESQSYLHRIYEMNKDEQNPYSNLLRHFPKRMVGNNASQYAVWNNINVPSLTSYLHSKQEERTQETDYNLLRIRMGSKGNESVYSQKQQQQQVMHNNTNNNTNMYDIMRDIMKESDTYYSQMNNMNIFGEHKELTPVPIKPSKQQTIIELKDEEHGRTLRLDQDILAINLVQPWAYCLVNRLCKIFCFKTEFDSDKYPNGYWYAIRVHANSNVTKHVTEDCELLSSVMDDVPVIQDSIHTAQHVIGFAHVYKSSILADDVSKIHPELVDVYAKCHGGLTYYKKKNIISFTEAAAESKLQEMSVDVDDTNNNNINNENNDNKANADEVVVDDNKEKDKIDDNYDGYWYDIELEESPLTRSTTNTPQKRKRRNHIRQRHYWFVDKVFKIKPYQVTGTLGGVSRFYNVSKRNCKQSLFLGKLLSNYLFKQLNPKNNANPHIDRHTDQNIEDNDAKLEELPVGDLNTSICDDVDVNEEESAEEDGDSYADGVDDGGVIYIDRTLGKHVGIKSKKKKKLHQNKKINGWRNVLNDFTVIEVEISSDERIAYSHPCDMDNSYNFENSLNGQENAGNDEPAVKGFEMFSAVGMIQPMENTNLFQTSSDLNPTFNQMYDVRAPHIDDSSDSDYLGDEEDCDLEQQQTQKAKKESNITQNVSKSVSIPKTEHMNDNNDNNDDDECADDDDDDIDLADIEQELLHIGDQFVTRGGPNDDIDDDMQTIAVEDIDKELQEILHNEEEIADVLHQELDMEINININGDNNDNDFEQYEDDDMIPVKEQNIETSLEMNMNGNEEINITETDNDMLSINMEPANHFNVKNEGNNQHKSPKKLVFNDDVLAFNEINKVVYNILSTASEEEKKVLSKKNLRKLVAKQLNISKNKYKHIIDKCGKDFVSNLSKQRV